MLAHSDVKLFCDRDIARRIGAKASQTLAHLAGIALPCLEARLDFGKVGRAGESVVSRLLSFCDLFALGPLGGSHMIVAFVARTEADRIVVVALAPAQTTSSRELRLSLVDEATILPDGGFVLEPSEDIDAIAKGIVDCIATRLDPTSGKAFLVEPISTMCTFADPTIDEAAFARLLDHILAVHAKSNSAWISVTAAFGSMQRSWMSVEIDEAGLSLIEALVDRLRPTGYEPYYVGGPFVYRASWKTKPYFISRDRDRIALSAIEHAWSVETIERILAT